MGRTSRGVAAWGSGARPPSPVDAGFAAARGDTEGDCGLGNEDEDEDENEDGKEPEARR